AGVLSALGIGLADPTVIREQSVERPLAEDSMPTLRRVADALTATATAQLREQHPHGELRVTRQALLRYDGTDTAVPVPFGTPEEMTASFEAAYRRTYSFLLRRPIIVEALSVEAVGVSEPPDLTVLAGPDRDAGPARPDPVDRVRLYSGDRWHQAPLWLRDQLRPGDQVSGPAIVAEANATTVVDDGWRATVTEYGHLRLDRGRARTDDERVGPRVDPVLLEIFNNLFMSIAEQMGARLESTAQSVNIKERLDFSCALFDPEGNLIANAPHMPVHLGSMGATVREVIRRRAGDLRPGDVYAVNDPYHGGTHLPDVTVVTPVYDA